MIQNSQPVPLERIPCLDSAVFRNRIIRKTENHERIVSFFGNKNTAGQIVLFAVMTEKDGLSVTSTKPGDTFESLTPSCPQFHWFERELAETWSLNIINHSWMKPLRFCSPLSNKTDVQAVHPIGEADYFQVEGQEIHEVAVGPVHAGIIEPGHFRFQCFGENVLHLEISLGYQHRGVEKALLNGPDKKTLHYMETVCGDSSIAHGTAYCQLMEGLNHCFPSARAQMLRGIMLELERVANHVGDLGAMANDVGYLPTASYCGRLRGEFLNMTAFICGNRFGRSMLCPGGIRFDIDPNGIEKLFSWISKVYEDTQAAVELLWNSPSVLARFEGTGTLSLKTVRELGIVGVAARACGLEEDVRSNYPSGINRFVHIPVSTWNTGDVFARGFVRWLEIQRSVSFIKEQIQHLVEGPIIKRQVPLQADQFIVSLVEGFRGEIVHAAVTDHQGRFKTYKITDPSFHNWFGLAYAMRNQEISDFPLCNKSFNLSYCGHDL